MSVNPPPPDLNSTGKASLMLGIISSIFAFGMGLFAIIGVLRGRIQPTDTIVLTGAAGSLVLNSLAIFLGLKGLGGQNETHSSAVAGLLLGLIGSCLFLSVVAILVRAAIR